MKNKILKNKLNTRDSLTVIEFSLCRIKLAQASFKKQGIITKLFVQDNKDDSEYELISTLEKLIKTNHLKIDNLLVSLDRSLVTIRLIKLPSANEEEIKNMAEWQAAKLLPYKAEEMVVSSLTIKVDENSFSHVLLVIVPKNIIKKYVDVCDALKLRPQAITLSSEGLLNWYAQLRAGTTTDAASALIDLEANKAELAVLYQDKFIFSRSFALGNVQGDNQIKKRIIEEVKLSIDSYQKQEIAQPLRKIVLTGDTSLVSDLPSLFISEFNLEAEVTDHFKNLNLEKDISRPAASSHVSFASICGLALSEITPKINLLPGEVKDKMLYLEKKKELFKTIFVALSAFLLFLGIFGFDLYNKKKIIASLDRQIEKLNPAASGIQNIKNKITIINAQLNNESSCIGVLREIYRITPQDIYLNTFIFEEANQVTLKGTAPTMSVVFSFVPILNDSKFFENVQVRYATQRKTEEGELTDFEIICKLSPNLMDK